MSIFQLYFLQKFFTNFIFIFGVEQIVFGLGAVIRATDFGNVKVSADVSIEIFALSFPFFAPITLSSAFCLALWLVVRDIKKNLALFTITSFGVSPISILRFTFLLSLLFSSLSLLFSFYISPKSFRWAHYSLSESIDKIESTEKGVYVDGIFASFDKRNKDNSLENIFLVLGDENTVFSNYGTLKSTKEKFNAVLKSGVMFFGDTVFSFDHLEIEIFHKLAGVGSFELYEFLHRTNEKDIFSEAILRFLISLSSSFCLMAYLSPMYFTGVKEYLILLCFPLYFLTTSISQSQKSSLILAVPILFFLLSYFLFRRLLKASYLLE